MDESSAVYEPMLAIGWVGTRPDDYELACEVGAAVPDSWREVVVDRDLPCGISVRFERRALVTFDFRGWAPGVARRGLPALRTFRQVSEAAKPAAVARLRVVNSLLTLLHAASMVAADESPRVVRVHERDLYRYDHPDPEPDSDESPDGYWHQPLGGPLPAVVTLLDRHRYGVISTATVDLALQWLDTVVDSDALVPFDLLNHTQAALVTHDYGLAVTTGWTVCELQSRRIARTNGFNRDLRTGNAEPLCKELGNRNLLPNGVDPTALSQLRRRRNRWLHDGREPDEQTALDALRLATGMLKPIVPDLRTRTMRGLLVL